MTGATAFHPFGQRHRLVVEGGHGFHCRPGQRMLPMAELFHLRLVALAAGFRRGNLRLGSIRRSRMVGAVAGIASDAHAGVFA